MKPRLQDIAREAGVSVATVSLVLNGRHLGKRQDAVERGRRVREVVERLGYRPNASARVMQSGRFQTVALVMSPEPHRSTLPSELLIGITRELAKHNLHLLVEYVSDKQLTSEASFPLLLRERSCDGMLLNYHAHVPAKLEALTQRFNLPVVWLNAQREYDSVYPDDFDAAKTATERLIALGHRRIAYADLTFYGSAFLSERHYSKVDRRAGYEAAMKRFDLPVELLLDPEQPEINILNNIAVYLEKLRRVFKGAEPPTAVISYSGEIDLLHEILAETGRRTEIVSFMGSVEDIEHMRVQGMLVPFKALATHAVECLQRKIAHPDQRVPSVAVPFDSYKPESDSKTRKDHK